MFVKFGGQTFVMSIEVSQLASVTALHSYLILSSLADYALLVGTIQSLTTASGSCLFGSVIRAVNLYPDRPGSKPKIGGFFFFSYASILCYDFHVVRCGLVRDRRKWLRIIINYDFLEEGVLQPRRLRL